MARGVRGRAAARVAARPESLGEVDVEEAAELMVRLAFSFVLIPRERRCPLDDEEKGAVGVAWQLLTPILEP